MNALLSSVLVLSSLSAAGSGGVPPSASKLPNQVELQAMAARFAPVRFETRLNGLSPGDHKAVAKLVEASRVVDALYLQQSFGGTREQLMQLAPGQTPVDKARRRLLEIYKGPWAELDGHTAFVPGVPARKPAGAQFYPADMTKEEFETWVKGLPAAEQEAAKGFFTVIRRGADGKLAAVPYSVAYAADLQRAAGLLREAAALTDNASLKTFLTERAAAFLSNDYYASDLAWMDIDAPVDVTVGPYETYVDELFGYKAAFEAYVTLRDDAETAKLAGFSKHLQEIENNLPIEPRFRNPKIGGAAPIRVVNEVFASGDAAHGVRTAAFNLPNDERVILKKGAKRVMLKNVQEAKFNSILKPISERVLAKGERKHLSFDAFFTHILAHELCHGLGPHHIDVGGRKTTVRAEMKDLYSSIEEAKADITGLFALQYLIDNAERLGMKFAPGFEGQLYTTFVASTFRTLRFGVHEAHGRGMALQVNYFLEKGAMSARPDGTFALDLPKMKQATRDLATELLTTEATGDYARAQKLLEKYGGVRPEVQKALEALSKLPTDIEPLFVTAEKIAPVKVARPAKAK